MSVLLLLAKIQSSWLQRVTHDLARGTGVRENFEAQLNRFYDLLAHAIDTGDPAWLDQIIYDWSASPTQSELEEGQKNLTTILNHIFAITYATIREKLAEKEALDLTGALIPIFTHALEKAARYEMETRVAFISNELTTVQQKMERLDRSKSNFIAVAAHELKTPLTLIEGYTAMMRDLVQNNENGQFDAVIHGVNNGIRRLQAIVDDMIDVSLIDNNLLSLNFQPVWLGQLLGLLRNDVNPDLQQRNQTLTTVAFPGSETMIFADPERLYQAFHNLLTNAIKYTPDGGEITVDGRTLPGFIEITIADTGIGISLEDQETIFEKFGALGNASLHSSGKTKFKGGGPGLGLPISRGIFDAHGGTIWVESEGYDEEKCPGSTFHVLLPIRTELPDPQLARLFGTQQPEPPQKEETA
ncbi:MAG: HAMP domain-containing histidine kinase [Anaerolineales bacterium]|nr:HAMP domain-containing histidine kinase [Anaerolineales bacterium]